MQFLITDELDKREEQDAWLESSKVAQRKKNSFFSSAEQMVLIGTIWNTWEKPLSLTEPIFCEGQRVHWEYPMPSLAAHSFICSFLLCSTFCYFKYFCFYKINMEWELRGAPGCSRSWESDFCQLQTLQMRICKIRESGSAATPLFVLEPFK